MSIVVAVDGESSPDPGLELGAELADRFDDDLLALHVMPQGRFERIRDSVGGDEGTGALAFALYEGYADRVRQQPQPNPYTIDVAQEDAANAAREIVETTLGSRGAAGVQGRVGRPAEEIVEEADRRDARYLVIGGRKRTPVGKAVFGSITQTVLLNANQPVVTVPKDGIETAAKGPVVAAVDRTPRASQVVEQAGHLADALDRPLHVVHVLSRGDYVELEAADDIDRSALSEEDVRSAAADVADDAADGRTAEFTAVGLVGEPSEELLSYADDQDAGFLVLAGRRRSPVGKVLFGSVTQSVLLSTERPVLTVMGEE